MTRLALLALFAVGCSTVAAQEAVPLAVGAVEADLLETRGALSQAETQLEQLYAAATADAEASAATEAQLEAAQSSLSSAQRAYRSTQGQLSQAQGEVERLLTALSASGGQVDALTRELAEAQGKVAALSQTLATAQASAGRVPMLQAQVAQLQDELVAARRQERATAAGIAQLEQENRLLVRDLRGMGPLQHQLQAAIADVGRLQSLSFEQGRQVDQLQSRVASFRQQARDAERERTVLAAQNQALKGEKSDLARENRSLKEQNAQLLAKLRALESHGAAPAQQASAPAPAQRPGAVNGQGRPAGNPNPHAGDGQGRPDRGDRGDRAGSGRPAERVAMK